MYSVIKNACTVQMAVVSQVMDSTKRGQNQKMLKDEFATKLSDGRQRGDVELCSLW